MDENKICKNCRNWEHLNNIFSGDHGDIGMCYRLNNIEIDGSDKPEPGDFISGIFDISKLTEDEYKVFQKLKTKLLIVTGPKYSCKNFNKKIEGVKTNATNYISNN